MMEEIDRFQVPTAHSEMQPLTPMRASAVTILWYFGIPVPLMITTPVGFFGSEERLWIPCSVYSCAPDRKSKCTTFSMGQLSRKHRAESCCLQTLAYLHKSNPTELLGGAGSLRGVRGQGLIMRARRHQDPAAASISDGDCDAREGESVAMNYKPSPLQVKLEKQRELARKGSLKNGSMGSPVNQQPKKNNVMARTRLVVPNKGYSSLDQSPDEKPLVALDTDSDDDFDMSRYSSSGYSSAEINQDLNIQLLKDGYRLDEIPDDEDLDLIPPKSVNPTCMCCQATSSTACHIQ
ncbi:protein FAM219A isoform X3 [Cricetulus griseus]|uniref:Protein FAM219A isoform X3 n=1 Tax=Cricetulus griseus TaxID=10029 RepID=A0A9J7FFM7_CRIGR|nr:protein FAM219A isoform X3 [Cricetulus griseus]